MSDWCEDGGNLGEHPSKPSELAQILIPAQQAFFAGRRLRR